MRSISIFNSHIIPAANRILSIVVCPECQATFDNGFKSLEDHARSSRHRCFTCRYTGCGLAFYLTNELISHESTHTDHARIVPTLPNTCPECQDHFGTARELDAHCNKHQHRFYACKCGSVFSRSDVLARHLNRYHPTMPKYPCLHCNRHRGYDGFRRRDHLTQHLQGYHHRQTDQSIRPLGDYFSRCPYPECPKYITSAMTISQRRGEYPPCFESQAHFTKHMRETHDESLFPCKVPYCIKVGGKGYARERDLINHHKNLHPEAPPYVVADFSCIEQNCREVLYSPNRFQLAWHYVEYHGYEGEDARRMVGMNS